MKRTAIFICRRAILLLFLSLPPAPLHARAADMGNGSSPNAAYKVRVRETTGTRAITYEVVEVASDKVLLGIRSSYQPESSEPRGWAWNHTNEAEIHWSRDSHCLFIDEQVHNHLGKIFIIAVRDHTATRDRLPENTILGESGCVWERYRIRVSREDDGSNDKVILTIAGRVDSSMPGATLNLCFDFPVTLRNCRVVAIGSFTRVY